MEIIDYIPLNEWKYWEKFWISYFKFIGCNLLNHTGGGDGLSTCNNTSFKKGQGGIPIYQIDLKGNIINVFSSTIEACNKLGYKIGTTDKIGRTTKNFIFYKVKTWDKLNLKDKNNIILKANTRFCNKGGLNTRFKKGHNLNKNKTVSKDTKLKISEANKGKIPWNKGKTIGNSKKT